MKNLLILPGGSARNLLWGQECEKFFKDDFDTSHLIQYDHWKSGDKNVDFEKEIEKINEVVRSCEGEWYVFAKSIGSILALKAVQARGLYPVKCVFFGMPFNLVAESVFLDDWTALSNFNVPAIAFHNTADPTANYGFTEEKLAEYTEKIRLISLEGNTHEYFNFADFQSEVKRFIQ